MDDVWPAWMASNILLAFASAGICDNCESQKLAGPPTAHRSDKPGRLKIPTSAVTATYKIGHNPKRPNPLSADLLWPGMTNELLGKLTAQVCNQTSNDAFASNRRIVPFSNGVPWESIAESLGVKTKATIEKYAVLATEAEDEMPELLTVPFFQDLIRLGRNGGSVDLTLREMAEAQAWESFSRERLVRTALRKQSTSEVVI